MRTYACWFQHTKLINIMASAEKQNTSVWIENQFGRRIMLKSEPRQVIENLLPTGFGKSIRMIFMVKMFD